MRVLMVASEMMPFAKTGGLADVAGALPLALAELGVEVSVVIPCYRGIIDRYKPSPAGIEVTVPILDGDHYIDRRGEILHYRLENKIDVYFVRMDEYFDREALYMLPEGDYPDNCARFTFFCRAALEMLRAQNRRPDLIHCHDWQTALVPIYLNTVMKDDPLLGGVPAVFTIHNLGYQGLFWHWDMKMIGLPWQYFTVDALEYFGKLNLLKGALVYANAITTVSKGYAREIQEPERGLGLDGVIRNRVQDLHGIVNGIDYSVWDPAIDPEIEAHYSPENLAGKARCKAALQKELGLPLKEKTPLVGVISRLADQKGFDLIAAVIDKMMKAELQFALLGTGDKKYHEIFENIAVKYPKKTGIRVGYDEGLAHRIEAGADIFLMPSLYEPCGLNQLISLKYGTVPVVRATGGLDDTIDDFDPATGRGNGFKFRDYAAEDLWKCLARALDAYSNKELWRAVMKNGMKEDHSWKASAQEYVEVYRKISG